ncbi:hypothetical protein QQS21_011128 [Conoideocrella luteorostrata]|uniref:PAC domain-containing protein n=1 Tax=Conoideocrella luteorostrata TaxID=1105319 RepID=A0AAJ0FTL3_9HYPO|nr:hypothetical protein QQS21_011128 [Conoideocrella luteorostrata]
MDPASTSAVVPPLSPTVSSSHSEASLDEPDFAVKPLPLPPSSPIPMKGEDGLGDLPALQVAQGDPDGLDPIAEDELDPGSFDLVMPVEQTDSSTLKYKLEKRSELLFSNCHLQAIFDDSSQLHRFSNFLYRHRPASVPLLTYFLNALKALRAIEYSNAVLRQLCLLSDFEFTHEYYQAQHTANPELQDKANTAFDILAREDLPMYITHVWIQTVSVSIKHRIMGVPNSASEGLAEVFCLTDPSRHDNPIVFMSEEFNRTTQYGTDYVIGRNCRFLQGPYSNPFSVARIREKVEAGVEHYETFLNYRRDGSPFMNLVMIAPLYDSRGVIRYFIGAQVDVSGLAMGCYDLGGLKRVVDEDERPETKKPHEDEFTQLAEILAPDELDIMRERGGEMHRLPLQADMGLRSDEKIAVSSPLARNLHNDSHHTRSGSRNRVVLRQNGSQDAAEVKRESLPQSITTTTAASLAANHNGRLTGVYEHYLLVRPYPSLRILFTSPSMRVPGILQSPLLDRIGGSVQMRDQLVEALAGGNSVTAKVKWLTFSHKAAAVLNNRPPRKNLPGDHPLEAHVDEDDDIDAVKEAESMGRSRWLHCTPLVGSNGKVGVWMVVIVDDELDPNGLAGRRSNVAATEHIRPGSSMSDKVFTAERTKDGQPKNAMMNGRPRIRARRSSETLGATQSNASSKADDDSVTKVIHNQHSSTSLRTPKPSLKTPGVSARFYSLEALSRAASARSSAMAEIEQQRKDQEGANMAKQGEERKDTLLQLWPKPPSTSNPSHAKRNREAALRIPSIIRETSTERSKPWGRRRKSRDGESSSLKSQSSALTVNIEEGL